MNEAMAPEFSRPLKADEAGAPRERAVSATPDERAALATRFGLLKLDRLEAKLTVERQGKGLGVTGSVSASGDQACTLSGEPVPFAITAPVTLRYAPLASAGGEVELSEDDLDTEPWNGQAIDLGEIAAETMALALDPYPRAAGIKVPGVISEDEAVIQASPFRVLKGGKAEA
jgi:uncharacterized metal-binding protein YceD (DUF177 family)